MSDSFLVSPTRVTPVTYPADPIVTGRLNLGAGEARAKSEAKPAEDKVEKPAARTAADSSRNIRLRFEVDPKSNEVKVLLVDTATRRVVRTVPPDELRQLAEGELVELFT